MPEMRRLFIALWPDDITRTHIYEYQQALAQASTPHSPGRPVARENLHLTLCFLGNVAEPAIGPLSDQLERLPPPAFELQLQTPGYFRRPRISWLGPEQPVPALSHLAAQINQAACEAVPGFRPDPNSFIAHVSLFRQARACPPALVGKAIHWPVHDFALIESINQVAGPSYRVLQRWPSG